jgi:hypothetical protein
MLLNEYYIGMVEHNSKMTFQHMLRFNEYKNYEDYLKNFEIEDIFNNDFMMDTKIETHSFVSKQYGNVKPLLEIELIYNILEIIEDMKSEFDYLAKLYFAMELKNG